MKWKKEEKRKKRKKEEKKEKKRKKVGPQIEMTDDHCDSFARYRPHFRFTRYELNF